MMDNSLAKAQSLGALDGNSVSKRDSLNKRDRVDSFTFTLNRSSNIKLKLSGLKANADLTLLDGTGKTIVRSAKSGNKAEKVQRQLAAGTYFVQVKGKGGSTKYQLKGSAVSAGGGTTPIPAPGTGTRNNPIDLGTLTNAPVGRSRDTAGLFDGEQKFYKFQLGQISDVNIRLSQVTGNGTVRLYYDSNRNGVFDLSENSAIDVATGSESANDAASLVLPATGTYFMEALSNSTTNNVLYDLTVTPTPAPGNLLSDPGPEESTAYSLGTLNRGGQLEAKDYVGRVDETDVYRFTLAEAANLAYSKTETAGDVFSVNSTLFQDKNNNGLIDANEQVVNFANITTGSVALPAGNYFLSTKASNVDNAAYSLTLAAS